MSLKEIVEFYIKENQYSKEELYYIKPKPLNLWPNKMIMLGFYTLNKTGERFESVSYIIHTKYNGDVYIDNSTLIDLFQNINPNDNVTYKKLIEPAGNNLYKPVLIKKFENNIKQYVEQHPEVNQNRNRILPGKHLYNIIKNS